MTKSWSVRAYRPGDEAAILDLARLVFTEQPADRFSLDYWHWEYVSNSSGPARIWLAVDGDRLIGHYAVVPRTIQVGDRVQTGSVVIDLMTHPDYRRQGSYLALAQRAWSPAGAEGIDFGLGFVVRAPVIAGAEKFGWAHPFDIPVLARPLRFDRVLRTHLNVPIVSDLLGQAARIAYEFGARPVLRAFQPRVGRTADISLQEVSEIDERFDGLWSKAERQFPVMGVRDCKYLNWRYCQHPYYNYRIWIAQRGQQLLGYVVTRTGDLMGLRSGIIVDMLADSDHLPAVDWLLRAVIREFRKSSELDLIACMMSRGGPYFNALQRHGFIVTPKFFSLTVNINQERAPAQTLLRPGNWYLTWGDTDVI